MLTEKQKRFIDYYIQLGNATEAAKQAGYSKKTAFNLGARNLKNPLVKKELDKRLDEMKTSRIADATEVLEYLTSVVRGEAVSEIVVVEGCGMGESRARAIDKAPDEKERLKAAELLAKRYGLLTEKVEVTVTDIGWYKDDDDE